ncbi:heavy metal-associated isoprenylated plant protein 33-like [Heracleum sosnowskyi]|uniref:Heavy metal-associated isoprenylated plant protein 33-like n=1 Tax=Heracleum sosnowskyi TaxID=360622 RepID=A0AAD8NEH7_9APIA|nr:heavy metal-associated isoprenylated plant protein 33-like [Heracleum sosnowskyi]
MGCVLKISPNCEACKMKVVEIVGSICGLYNISIDAERGIADISGQVDPNMLLYALGKAGQHAELLRVKLQHPSLRYNHNSHHYYGAHGLGMTDMYGYGGHYHQPYPIHDPYWYSRNIQDPYHYPHHANYHRHHHANYHRRYPYRSTSSFGFAPIRNGCCHRVY